MASVNKAILVGNICKDLEVKYMPNGNAVVNFPLATNESYVQDGEKKEKTEFHNIVVYGKQAENCGKYLVKGRQIYIEGSIRTRNYKDKEGVTRYITEIVCQHVQFLGGAPGGTHSGQGDVPEEF